MCETNKLTELNTLSTLDKLHSGRDEGMHDSYTSVEQQNRRQQRHGSCPGQTLRERSSSILNLDGWHRRRGGW